MQIVADCMTVFLYRNKFLARSFSHLRVICGAKANCVKSAQVTDALRDFPGPRSFSKYLKSYKPRDIFA